MAKVKRQTREHVVEDMSSVAEDIRDRLDGLDTELMDFERDSNVRLARGHLLRWKAARRALQRAFESFADVVDGIEAAFAEDVSCAMGLDGEITSDVLAQAQILLDHKADLADPDIRGLVRAVWAMKRGEEWSGTACGSCGMLHPANFSGDCRDDNHRLPVDLVDFVMGATEDELEMVGLTLQQAQELSGDVWD